MSDRTRRTAAIGAALALATTTLAAPVTAEESSLVYVVAGDVGAVNNSASNSMTSAVGQWLYNGLYAYDESLTPVPDIAADYAAVGEDGTVWTINLRDDVYFQPGGEQLTAEDVVFTYQLAMSENCRFNPSGCLGYVKVTPEGSDQPVPVLQSVEAIDDLTVQFTLADVYAPFSTEVLPFIWIESKSAIMDAFAEFQEEAADVSAADVDALLTSMGEADDDVPFRDDAAELLTAAGLELPDESHYVGEDGSLDETAYTGALESSLTDLSLILHADEIDQVAAAYAYLDTGREPVGTGPFYLTEFRAGQDLTATRNETYHHGPASFEKLYIPIIKDDVAAAAALAGGELDWKRTFTADGYEQVRNVPGLKFALYPDFGYFGLQFNLREGRLFHDKAMRQALAYCIDKEATVAAATDGTGIPIYADQPPASWAYNPDVPRYEYDVEAARALLEEAGWTDTDEDGIREKDGRELSTTILARAGKPDRTKFMHLLADQARDCGFDLSIIEADFSVMWPGLQWPLVMAGQDEQWDAYFGGWGTSYDPNPYGLWHSSNCVTEEMPEQWNYICFQNERADELIEAGLTELDHAKRVEIYQEFELIMAEELPYLWAWSEETREGLDVDIHGAEVWTEEAMTSPTWFWQLEQISKGGRTSVE